MFKSVIVLQLVITVVVLSDAAQKPAQPNLRIVGGSPVNITKHPHQISIRIVFNRNGVTRHTCGGSIITNRMVLTAAHCLFGRLSFRFMIIAGTSVRNGKGGVAIGVKRIFLHEKFAPGNFANDIAVLVLNGTLPIDNIKMKPIKLIEERPPAGTKATVTGWGFTREGGIASENLREVQVPILTNEDCKKDYAAINGITNKMICAGFRGVGTKDACQDDSGGPLVVNGELVGIVSWGYGCARKNYPGVYTSVADYRDWIMQKIQENQ